MQGESLHVSRSLQEEKSDGPMKCFGKNSIVQMMGRARNPSRDLPQSATSYEKKAKESRGGGRKGRPARKEASRKKGATILSSLTEARVGE